MQQPLVSPDPSFGLGRLLFCHRLVVARKGRGLNNGLPQKTDPRRLSRICLGSVVSGLAGVRMVATWSYRGNAQMGAQPFRFGSQPDLTRQSRHKSKLSKTPSSTTESNEQKSKNMNGVHL